MTDIILFHRSNLITANFQAKITYLECDMSVLITCIIRQVILTIARVCVCVCVMCQSSEIIPGRRNC